MLYLVKIFHFSDEEQEIETIHDHIQECTYDWNIEEIDKPEDERIPLPAPSEEFIKVRVVD